MSLLTTDQGTAFSGEPSQSQLPTASSADVDGARSLHARGRQGEVCVHLQRWTGGLYVEREEIPRRGLRTWQAIHFDRADDFERWCNADPLRFEHPLLYTQLRRAADALLPAGLA